MVHFRDRDADPPPFSLVNPQGSAAVLLVCDHASRELPPGYGSLGLDEAELWRHIAWDIGAAEVTRQLARLLDAPAVLSGVSRLLIDCNRALDDPTLVCQVSDGTVVPGNRDLPQTEIDRRIARFYRPYQEAVAGQIQALLRRAATPALVSVHSFTPVMKGFERPWHVGILWNDDPRLAVPLMRALAEEPDVVVGDNEPYSARDNVGYTTARHAAPIGLPHVLLEIRQDLIDTLHGAEAWARRIAAALQRVLVESASGGSARPAG